MNEQAINLEWRLHNQPNEPLRRSNRITLLSQGTLSREQQKALASKQERQDRVEAGLKMQQEIFLGLLGSALHVGPLVGAMKAVTEKLVTTSEEERPFDKNVEEGLINFLADATAATVTAGTIVGIMAFDSRFAPR